MNQFSEFVPYMKKALQLAARARFLTCPNPNVGAVLVKNDKIVAEGWHKAAGGSHAEIECLADAKARGINAAGCTMVVTLEPCQHYGKTPPCTDAILEAAITTLVYGCKDPNTKAGGGAQILESRGVNVIGPVLEQECKDAIADFLIWQTTQRPYIILKLASTIDGRIATRAGHSRWISNEASRLAVHRMRADIGRCGGAILIGGGTFRADNPTLSARVEGAANQPIAAVLTSRLPKADSDYTLLRERPRQTVFFASPAAAASTTAESLRKLGCRVIAIGNTDTGMPDFDNLFKYLRNELGCPYVLCEGGGSLALQLLETGYLDEFHLYMAPLILGDKQAPPLFSGRTPLTLEEALKMRLCSTSTQTGDALLCFRPA